MDNLCKQKELFKFDLFYKTGGIGRMNIKRNIFGKEWTMIILFVCVILLSSRLAYSQLGKENQSHPRTSNSSSDSSRTSFGLKNREESANRDRPPTPAKKPQDLQFPENFLTPSREKTNIDQAKTNTPGIGKGDDLSQNEWKKYLQEQKNKSSDLSSKSRSDKTESDRKDPTMIFASILASLGFGIFALADYRYRCRLQDILSRNNRLLSPEATSSDFEGFTRSASVGSSPFLFNSSGPSPVFNKYMDNFKSSGSCVSSDRIGSTIPDIRPLADHEFYTEK